ncbi:threonyl-tRNA synthetase [Coniosporium tulheliwenetii]|uniref:Threonyl-tRNA synthetase n=1 Tax=Coniosporium tulheliwenetii TaxID=3383036 RepID=A0ACC2ZHS0_9PEZI|nr:threonyl-tRNA synthetase [Cladosporium sp. JES 115]
MEAVKDAVDGVKNLAVQDGQKKQKKEKKPKGADSGDARPLELSPPPAYFDHRIRMFEELKAKYDEEVSRKPREPITITLADGKQHVGESWKTSPADIARGISKSLFERTVIARVDGELWDLERPLEKSGRLELLDFEDPEGKKVFWHSSAHILGEAAERRFGCDLCIGPPVEDGFYYEMALPGGEVVQQSDHDPLENLANKIVKEKQRFERLELSKDDLLEMFKTNKYKQHIIKDKIPDGSFTTVYRCGPLIDLCRGPHVPNTGRVKFFKVMKNSASYFLGDANNDSLQRIYGVSFPEKQMMAEHLKYLEEAAKRDHRKIGKEQELFFFHEWSPGSCFFLPHGMIIYNTFRHSPEVSDTHKQDLRLAWPMGAEERGSGARPASILLGHRGVLLLNVDRMLFFNDSLTWCLQTLQSFLRSEYWKRGYQEVSSPNMYNAALWKRSGHWQHYKDDMFTFEVEKDQWALKPMNCPGHCLMFSHRERSYRELPMRIADFGVLHRNEASGALTGLTRVRRFQQDDTHIFCTEEQIEQEITGLFDFLRTVYGKFGFTFKMKLSTRPDKYLGDVETWDKAEARLSAALDQFTAEGGSQWQLNPGDGAFYGPKIDITISDALKRTITSAKPKSEAPESQPPPPEQSKEDGKLDAVERELTPGCARPVMIHRAIYGSFERFIAILTEHFAGKWPFWLSPRQALVIPVMPAVNDYVREVQQVFRERGMHVDIDISGNTMAKKIRSGQLAQYNFIFVVGAAEKDSRTVNIRNRDIPETQKLGELVPLDEAISKLEALRESRALENKM